MTIRLAFVGFRHSHIFDLYRRAQHMPEVEVVAACEQDPATREQLSAKGHVAITHGDYEEMLAGVDCDAIAVGDVYAQRGQRAIQALEHGKHVISDKPLCTRLEELDEIARLAEENALCVDCMLDMLDAALWRQVGIRVRVRQSPMHCVVKGSAMVLSELGQREHLLMRP